MLSNCGHDENYQYHNGVAGDQTGDEWYLRPWYANKWTCVYRHPDANVRRMIARLAIEAAQNNNIGYDQNQRTTFWEKLKAAGYYPSKITSRCEADCSSGVAAIVKATGYLMGLSALKNVSMHMTTYSEYQTLTAAGFRALGSSAYLTSEANLVPGDIIQSNGHTATEVGTGRLEDYLGDDMPLNQDDISKIGDAVNNSSKLGEIAGDLGNVGTGIANLGGMVGGLTDKLNEVLERVDLKPPSVISGNDMFRLINTYTGAHVFTASKDERDDLIEKGWTDEGIGWTMPEARFIYRLYNKYTGDHLYTDDLNEITECLNQGWTFEKIAGVSGTDKGTPIHQLYNKAADQHLYTKDANEVEVLKSSGYTDEGIKFYGA